jgi:hypothetical protein
MTTTLRNKLKKLHTGHRKKIIKRAKELIARKSPYAI